MERRSDDCGDRQGEDHRESRCENCMTDRGAAVACERCRYERDRYGDCGFDNDRCGERVADCEDCVADGGRHDLFFLSRRTRSISALSASSSSSVHRSSATRAVIIFRREPPKKVWRYCSRALRLAAAGEIVAEYM